MTDRASEHNNSHALTRNLKLKDLILYGLVVIQPTAPMPLFGILSVRSNDHAVLAILLAMIAMLFTAMSYGRMAQVYPSAGSAFTYVGQEINPTSGFITGWSLMMDYILNPTLCIIWCSRAATNFAPTSSYWVWVFFFAILFTGLNLAGVKTLARINQGMAIAMGLVITLFFFLAARYITSQPHPGIGFFTQPLYNPHAFRVNALLGGTSLAVLTYIGFDSISTLSEEAVDPKRNILLATVLTCLVVGVLSAAEVYAGQLAWPTPQSFPELDTAFVYIAGRIGGNYFFLLMNLTLLVASIGSGIGSQMGAARLLFGMGRSNALPRSFFGKVEPNRHIPQNNVVFVGVVSLLGASLLSYSLVAEMLNFGALFAFMGVNAAAFIHHTRQTERRRLGHLMQPLVGGFICLVLWLNLNRTAFISGVTWIAAGIVLIAWRTRGFRMDVLRFEIPAALNGER